MSTVELVYFKFVSFYWLYLYYNATETSRVYIAAAVKLHLIPHGRAHAKSWGCTHQLSPSLCNPIAVARGLTQLHISLSRAGEA